MLPRVFVSAVVLCLLAMASPALSYDELGWYRDYGRYDDRNGRDVIRCESEDFSFHRCPVRTGGEAYIVRQLSETPCRHGQNWGYDRRGIWVDKGCAAEFAVGRREARRNDNGWYRGRDYGRGYGLPAAVRGTIRCQSEGFELTRCRVRTGGDVQLMRQLSETPCRRGENWGFDRRGIWVDKGCAAEFAVTGVDPYYTDRR